MGCRGVTTPTPFVDFSERSLYRARIAFLWRGNGNFEKWVQLRHFCTYRREILHTLRGRQYAKSCQGEFWISSPKKFGAPLNFAFALRPMGRKNSNRLYSSFRNSFGLIFLGLLGWRRESLFWDFLRFLRMGNVSNSIFLHFCMFYAAFNVSGTLEASALKFSHTMHRWWG